MIFFARQIGLRAHLGHGPPLARDPHPGEGRRVRGRED